MCGPSVLEFNECARLSCSPPQYIYLTAVLGRSRVRSLRVEPDATKTRFTLGVYSARYRGYDGPQIRRYVREG